MKLLKAFEAYYRKHDKCQTYSREQLLELLAITKEVHGYVEQCGYAPGDRSAEIVEDAQKAIARLRERLTLRLLSKRLRTDVDVRKQAGYVAILLDCCSQCANIQIPAGHCWIPHTGAKVQTGKAHRRASAKKACK